MKPEYDNFLKIMMMLLMNILMFMMTLMSLMIGRRRSQYLREALLPLTPSTSSSIPSVASSGGVWTSPFVKKTELILQQRLSIRKESRLFKERKGKGGREPVRFKFYSLHRHYHQLDHQVIINLIIKL